MNRSFTVTPCIKDQLNTSKLEISSSCMHRERERERANLHGGCCTHDTIPLRATKFANILIKPVHEVWRLMQNVIVLMNKGIGNLHSQQAPE